MSIIAVAMATVLSQGCPKPAKPIHHKHAVPMCMCGDIQTHTVFLPPEPQEPDPIELSIVPYYLLTDYPQDEEGSPGAGGNTGNGGGSGGGSGGGGDFVGGGYTPPGAPHFPEVRQTPEMDPSGALSTFTLLGGLLLIIRRSK